MKTCTKCDTTYPLTGFHRGTNPDGYRTWCKICVAAYKKQYVTVNCDRIRAQQKEYNDKKYPERRGYFQQRYANRKDAILEQSRLWRKNNPDRHAARENKRRASKLQRTPSWLTENDYWMIEQAYVLSALRTKLFGFRWEVDHIIPLKGKTVSGLHVPWNLQVIPALENRRKHNKLKENIS